MDDTPAVKVLSDTALDGKEAKDAFELVEAIQAERETRKLKAKDVPHILLPYQAAWHEDRSNVRFAKKSRRIGFSWGALAAEAVLEAMLQKGGMDQHYMGYNQGMAAEFIGDCAFFARAFNQAIKEQSVWRTSLLINNERSDIMRYKIQLASGHKIEAHSSNPHNWRGRKGHARIDEAAFHQDLKEVLKGAMAFLMWGGRVDAVSTMNGEDNDFTEICRDIEQGKFPRYSLHNVDFKRALREGFYKRVCLVQDKVWSEDAEEVYEEEVRESYVSAEDAAEELDCVPKRGSGAYFSRMLIEACQKDGIPILRYSKPTEFVLAADRLKVTQEWIDAHLKPVIDSMPTEMRTVFGQDFGRSGDLSVIWPLQEVTPLLWRMPFLLEMRNIPFDCQELITNYIGDNLPLFHHAKFDARGNGQQIAEQAMQRWGAQRVECFMASTSAYAELFPRYKNAYEGRNIVVAKSEDIIADHRSVVLVKGNPTMSGHRLKGSDGMFRHGDTAVAGVLAWAATLQEGQPAAGATIDPRPDQFTPDHSHSLIGDRLVKRPGAEFDGRKRVWR